MTLSEEAMQRLARLGYLKDDELKIWRDLWQSEGESLFWLCLRKAEEDVRQYDRWFPRLQAFASKCRRAAPVPAVDSFSTIEREQYRVLLAKMEEFAGSGDRRCILERKPHQAAILSTTRVGLAAAQQVFGGTDAILLQEEECERWFSEVYPTDQEAFGWYACARWSLREGLPDEDAESIRRDYPIPEGSSYWLVVSGIQWGSLAGGANHELWRWDGRRAEFIKLYCIVSY